MHLCFHGSGGGGCKIARPISFIRGFAKNMKAMSLKAKAGGGGGGRQEWARRRRSEADGVQQQTQDHKAGTIAAGAASASAKITPAHCQEEADGERHPHDRLLRGEKGEQGGGKKQQEYCDKCCSPLLDDDGAAAVVAKEEESVREWVAEPEPGVLMTLAPRPDGTNRLRRLRFREELFDALAAQSWWADNYDRVVELYSVVQSDSDSDNEADTASAMPVTPCQSEEDEQELPSGSPSTSNLSGEPSSGSNSGSGSTGTASSPILGLVTAPSSTRSGSKTPPPPPTTTTTTTRSAAQPGGHDDEDQPWTEWVEEYEAGVFITVRAYPDHPLQLRHVELSRERFGEVKARVWWQENKEKLHSLYSFRRLKIPPCYSK